MPKLQEYNNKSSKNKLNFPTVRTNQKIKTLLLLTLLNAYQIKGGEQFKDCLENHPDASTKSLNRNLTGLYDSLYSSVTSNTSNTTFCCDLSKKCESMSLDTQCNDLVSPRI